MFKRNLFLSISLMCFLLYTSDYADTYIVNNTNDSGPGSFRQAILDAESHVGDDNIFFQIPVTDPGYVEGQGMWIIRPTSDLPILWDNGTTIDGSTQADFIGSDTNPLGPEIVIDGIDAVEGEGLKILANHTIIKEITIHQFRYGLIQLFGDSNSVLGCYVGTGATGTERMNNHSEGIRISGGSYNTIGGPNLEDRNIISGNQRAGISIGNSSMHNQVIGNYIGINRTGTDTLSNREGIFIPNDSRNNIIGPENVISGNRSDGIYISYSDSNVVAGNCIGVDPSGETDMGNVREGMNVAYVSHIQIGGYIPEERNIISGNGFRGIYLDHSDSCEVIGNLIGTNVTGESAIPNEFSGIHINHSAYNQIGSTVYGGANIISGNKEYGIHLNNSGSMYNIIEGNKIGTNTDGALPLPNGYGGIYLWYGPQNNTIGPENIIAYNLQDGINIYEGSTIQNTITQNSIHDNEGLGIRLEMGGNADMAAPEITGIGSVQGTALLNATVEIFSTSDDEGAIFEAQVTADGDGNFHWAGTPSGPKVTATATDAAGNTSEFSLPMRVANLIVVNTDDSGEGSLRWAIDEANKTAGRDTIEFNIPVTDDGFEGTFWRFYPQTRLPFLIDDETVINGFSQQRNQGVENPNGPEIVLDGSQCEPYSTCFNIISEFNTIQGLGIGNFSEYGVNINSTSANYNKILGNYIGIDPDGQEAMPNANGILIYYGAFNTIGGSDILERNILSGNLGEGLVIYQSHDNVVIGNLIGTDHTGTEAIPNGMNGMRVDDQSYRNLIGNQEAGNVISGNKNTGLTLRNLGTRENQVYNNLIGVDITESKILKNGQHGISVQSGASSNIIGGLLTNEGNVISGNYYSGIWMGDSGTDSNRVAGNFIGTDHTGQLHLPNADQGVHIYSGSKLNQIGPGNLIRFNAYMGVRIAGEGAVYNRITENSISGNGLQGIEITQGGNNNVEAPVITGIGSVVGTALPNATVEIFSDSAHQGNSYEATVIADGDGNFSWEGDPTGPYVTATATDGTGNTSAFSAPYLIGGLVVTHTGDTGEGSLRWAIERANDMENPIDILFNISETDDDNFDGTVWWIRPQSPLPVLTNSGTVINGFSQRENQSETNPDGPEIVLDGRSIVEYARGFVIQASDVVICGISICGFNACGIGIYGPSGTNNHIWGNYIGTDPTGMDMIPNEIGIYISDDGNTIGGDEPGQGNIISGNLSSGIFISDSKQNQILGNYIGVNRLGYGALGNGYYGIRLNQSASNQIGGSQPGACNVISSNSYGGIYIYGEGNRNNKIQGNHIGVEVTGFSIVGFQPIGIDIADHARANQIGGNQPGEGNVISGHLDNGVIITGTSTDSNRVEGNYIGVSKDGLSNLGNGLRGIEVRYEAKHTQITGNLISGNKDHGILLSMASTDSSVITGNWIGLDATGQDTIPNWGDGIRIESNAKYEVIGGTDPQERNVISGNRSHGIRIHGDSTSYQIIENNYIGTDTSGTTALGNRMSGISLNGMYSRIQNNVISGNMDMGIHIRDFNQYHVIEDNLIGVQADEETPLPNGVYGIMVEGQSSLITIGPGNSIRNHPSSGIRLDGSGVQRITMTQNSIASNSTGILMDSGTNNGIQAPVILGTDPVTGTGPANCTIEIFSDSAGQGRLYLGSSTSDASGNWNFSGALMGPYITATATDEDGNTSVFSNRAAVATQVERGNEIPTRFCLLQNYPNPFNPETKIEYQLPQPSEVKLVIYDVTGQVVRELIQGVKPAGYHDIIWDGRNDSGQKVATGIYIYRVEIKSKGEKKRFIDIKKMVLMK